MLFGINKIKILIISIIAILISLILFVFIIVSMPFDYIRYKLSLFYKNERIPYFNTIVYSSWFNLYNRIYKNHLPITYVQFPNPKKITDGCFIYNHILIIINFDAIAYNSVMKSWYIDFEYGESNIDSISITDFINLELERVNKELNDIQCHSGVIFTPDECVIDYKEFDLDEKVLMYNDKNMVEVLKSFIKK